MLILERPFSEVVITMNYDYHLLGCFLFTFPLMGHINIHELFNVV